MCYIDEDAYKRGYALYRDRNAVTEEECKQWFMPIDDTLVSGERHFCRRESAFVEIESSRKVKRVRDKEGYVTGYAQNLFGEIESGLSLAHRPESRAE